jgi:hypothetical protein
MENLPSCTNTNDWIFLISNLKKKTSRTERQDIFLLIWKFQKFKMTYLISTNKIKKRKISKLKTINAQVCFILTKRKRLILLNLKAKWHILIFTINFPTNQIAF